MKANFFTWLIGMLFLSTGTLGADEPRPAELKGKSVPELIKALKDKDLEVRVKAAEALAALGSKAKEAGPALVEVMRSQSSGRDREPKFEAAKALWKVNSALYLDQLQGRDVEAQWTAVLALTYIGPSAKDAIPILVTIISDNASSNRPHALLALPYLDPDTKLALPLLTEALHDRQGQYARQMAAQGLEKMGAKAKPAVQDLRDALDDEDILVRVYAARAIWAVDRQSASALAVLRTALKDNSGRGGDYYAVDALNLMGADAKPAVPDLLEAYKIKAKNVRDRIEAALKKIDPEAAAKAGIPPEKDKKPNEGTGKAVPELIDALEDKKPEVRAAAAEALIALGPKAKVAGPALIKALGTRGTVSLSQEKPKFEVGKALWQVDPALYLQALKSEDQQVQWAATLELTSVGPAAKQAIPILVEMIKDYQHPNRSYSLLALAYLDPDPDLALPLLTAGLSDLSNEHARMVSAQGLEKMGPKAKPAVQDLRDALYDEHVLVRVWSARALWVVEGDFKSALAVFREALRDESARGGDYYAADALGLMGPFAKPAVPNLLAAYKVKQKHVQQRIEMALKKIDPEAAAKAGIK
jgi:HEAT repeat protein